jgi:hypothetical protein
LPECEVRQLADEPKAKIPPVGKILSKTGSETPLQKKRRNIYAANGRMGAACKMPHKVHRMGRNAGKVGRMTPSCGAPGTSLGKGAEGD